jgi:hypothetical protein
MFYQDLPDAGLAFEPLNCLCFKSTDWLVAYAEDSEILGEI